MPNDPPNEFHRSLRAGSNPLHTAGAARQLVTAIGRDAARVVYFRPSGRSVRLFAKSTLLVTLLAALTFAVMLLWSLSHVRFEKRPGFDGPSVLVDAANGDPLGRVGILSDSVNLSEVPKILIQAVLSIEDRRFYSHWGFDPWGIARAAHTNWSAGDIVEGGSTITQQLVKGQFVGGERSLDRKVREAFTAAWLDYRLGKDEILTQYLNSIYLGSGAYGMAAAARVYFDKKLADLSLTEAAMLAGLIQAPSRYDPMRNLETAQRRAAVVLDAMVETEAITREAAADAKKAPATLKLSAQVARAGSWFADWIAKDELPKIAGSLKRTIRIRSTLEPEVQRLAERVVGEALARPAEARGATQAALVALRPNGAVIAMVGGHNYDDSQFNRAVDAQRQPGSTFKLFVYYAALLHGYSPESIIDASPVEIGSWRPENYGAHHYGRMPLSQAFASSVNSAAVRLAMTVGLDNVVAAARELGIDAPLGKNPSMALGANEVTLLDLTGAFASVRAGKARQEPWGIAAFGPDGTALRPLGAPNLSSRDLRQRDQLTELLRAVVERGTGRAAAQGIDNAAGKTGTSQDHRDAWFVGFTNDLVAGVWVGNDDRSPMQGMTGGSLPAQIWQRFVSAATPVLARTGVASAPQAEATSPEQTSTPQCDLAACASRYNSFRLSDCTYQPYSGPRRQCELGQRSPNIAHPARPSEAVAQKSNPNDFGQTRREASHEPAQEEVQQTRRAPEMSLGGPVRAETNSRPVEPSRPSFGPSIFRHMDSQGAN